MTLTTTYTWQELEANLYTGFLDTTIQTDVDLALILAGIVAENYDPAFAAATEYSLDSTQGNMLTFV